MTPDWMLSALSGMIAALPALALALYVAYLQRKHNRLSVRPELITFISSTNDGVGKLIRNVGLGPARIRKLHLIYKGQHLPINQIGAEYKYLRERYDLPELPNPNLARDRFIEPIVILPRETHILFALPRDNSGFVPSEWIRVLNELDIYVQYESMYGEGHFLEKQRK